MTGGPNFLRSFATLLGGETAARLIGFVAVVVLTRELGPAGFGLVTLGTTLVLWFALVVDAGTEALGVREIARRPQELRAIAGPMLGLRLAVGLAAAGALAGGALLFASGDDARVLAPFALALPALALNLRWMTLGARGAGAVAAGNIAGQVVLVAGVLLLVRESADADRVGWLQAGGEAVYALVVLALVARRAGGWPRPVVDLAAWRATVRESAPLLVNRLARAALYSFDIFLIAAVLDQADVGVYGAAYKPILFVGGAVGLFAVSFLAGYSATSDGAARAQLLRRSTTIALAVALAAALAATLLAGPMLGLAFGDDYESGATALALLAWTLPALALQSTFGQALIADGRQAELMRHNLLGAGVAIAATVVAVPLAGIEGAAAATLAGQALVAALNARAYGARPTATRSPVAAER